MGKVYEALEKAEKEHPQTSWRALRGSGSTDDVDNASHRPEKFSFIQYSLNSSEVLESDEAGNNGVAAALGRDSQVEASRKVAIEIGRIDPHLVSFYDFDPRSSEQYRNLAITLIAAAEESPFKRVLMTSVQHREGRTCVTLNLACELALAKKRTLIIDCDLHRPSTLRLLGVESDVGLAETLGQSLPMSAALTKILPYDFDLLPTRSRVENPAELIASHGFRELLSKFDAGYDFILFDSPPLTVAASSLLPRLAHKTLLVVQAGRTGSSQMAKALAPLSRESLIGVVINRSEQ